MSSKKPLTTEEVNQMLKDCAQRQADLDQQILKTFPDACQSIYLKLPPTTIIPPECERLRAILKLQEMMCKRQ